MIDTPPPKPVANLVARAELAGFKLMRDGSGFVASKWGQTIYLKDTREVELWLERVTGRKRPTVAGPRLSPLPEADNEVRVRGEALHPVLWRGRQWAVTEFGIEARDGTYPIEAKRLLEKRAGTTQYDWPLHMREKGWVDMPDFEAAFRSACWIHRGVPMARHTAEAG